MTNISSQLQLIQQQIQLAEEKYGRPKNSVTLLAVSKHQSIEKIQTAFTAGQRCFGENYLQEALNKINALKDLAIEWHFIGHIQANKTQLIAQNFSWVHSIDRLKIAERLNEQRPIHLPPLNVCIEVNISNQTTKSGIGLTQLPELVHQISQLKNLKLRGLMAMPEPSENFSEQLEIFQEVQKAQMQLCAEGLALDTLSMGMSHDFMAAIAAGSTIVRIGTAIFGLRKSP